MVILWHQLQRLDLDRGYNSLKMRLYPRYPRHLFYSVLLLLAAGLGVLWRAVSPADVRASSITQPQAMRGTFASRPATGAVYYSTDVPIISQWQNGAWADWVFGNPVTLPAATSFSWRNQGGATLTINGIMSVAFPASGSDEYRGNEVALPSTPFTIDGCFTVAMNSAQFVNTMGLYDTDGTKLVTYGVSQFSGGAPGVYVGHWTNVTTSSSFPFTTATALSAGGQYCLRWNDDGSDINLSLSEDGGFSWALMYSESRTTFLTPTDIGWGGDPANNKPAALTLTSWRQH